MLLLVKYKAQHLTMWLCLLSELLNEAKKVEIRFHHLNISTSLSEAMEIFNPNHPPAACSTFMYKSTKSVGGGGQNKGRKIAVILKVCPLKKRDSPTG